MRHPLFSLTAPNKVRALIGTFAAANPVQFNRPDGAGYAFLADQVLALDRINPQIAARMLGAVPQLAHPGNGPPGAQARKALQRLARAKSLILRRARNRLQDARRVTAENLLTSMGLLDLDSRFAIV